MSEYTYRITFEHVKIYEAGHVLSPHLRNSQIPERHWSRTPTVVQTANPWEQYRQLKEWADNDTGMVRNVRLQRSVKPTEPKWEDVTP